MKTILIIGKRIAYLPLISVLVVLYGCKWGTKQTGEKYYISVEKYIKTNFNGSYQRCFNDMNEAHIDVASRKGIKPLTSTDQIEKYNQKLTLITSCNYYKLDSLTYSRPYLVPHAKDLLDNIGRSFCDTLTSRGGGSYRIIVTSLLRVEDDIKKLRRRNTNASNNSAHTYGTTFDISYRRFDSADPSFIISEENLRNLLAEILYDLKMREQCYIKYEVKQGCFHITAR